MERKVEMKDIINKSRNYNNENQERKETSKTKTKIIKQILEKDIKKENLETKIKEIIKEYIGIEYKIKDKSILKEIMEKEEENEKIKEIFIFSDKLIEIYPEDLREKMLKRNQRIIKELNKEIKNEKEEKEIIKKTIIEIRDNIKEGLKEIYMHRKIRNKFEKNKVYHVVDRLVRESTMNILDKQNQDNLGEKSIIRLLIHLTFYGNQIIENQRNIEDKKSMEFVVKLAEKLKYSPISYQINKKNGYNEELQSYIYNLGLITFLEKKTILDLDFIIEDLEIHEIISLSKKEYETPNNQIFNNSTRIILDCYHKIFRKFRKEISEKCHILNILWEDFDLEEYNEYISLFDQVVEISSPQQIENQENIPNLEDQNKEQEIKD